MSGHRHDIRSHADTPAVQHFNTFGYEMTVSVLQRAQADTIQGRILEQTWIRRIGAARAQNYYY